ncbi:hypothetical protein INR49_030468 [Caranx melampygus]|nr:hypothetical protein INR49_030468 [Caranx melampygus]
MLVSTGSRCRGEEEEEEEEGAPGDVQRLVQQVLGGDPGGPGLSGQDPVFKNIASGHIFLLGPVRRNERLSECVQLCDPDQQQWRRMGSSAVQITCVAIGVLGLIGAIVCCVVPRWKVSSFIGSNIVIAQSTQEGLWMSCVTQSTGQQQCKRFESVLQLSSEMQAARAMTIISGLLSGLSLLVLFCGADFTTCIQNEDAKPKISLAAGVGLVLSGLLLIIPVSWSAHKTVRDFNNPLVPQSQRMELGACIFIGWAASVLLLLAGGLLCCFSRRQSGGSGGTAKYYSNGASAPNKTMCRDWSLTDRMGGAGG